MLARSDTAAHPSEESVTKTPQTSDAWGLLDAHIVAFAKKANHNKRESLLCFLVVVATTLFAPLFIAFGDGLLLGKIVPSCCSLLATGATAWLQLRKPQQLWTLYRTAQRELEDHRTRYQFHLEPYDTQAAEKELAKRVADIALGVHKQWVPLVPSPEHLKLAETSPSRSASGREARDVK